ncbi:uncharacterized protein LOC106069315 [Biomphalaria glabrata]|uniref:Uncharacterized protein LOC106069315 n=1 Tax=Biomphalaria glabrata TaxID=6526 RepID=A0A9W2Z6W6_BIOGL|nr:uncharacterized protein LOC106069315 [Biomphalaria glabrata]
MYFSSSNSSTDSVKPSDLENPKFIFPENFKPNELENPAFASNDNCKPSELENPMFAISGNTEITLSTQDISMIISRRLNSMDSCRSCQVGTAVIDEIDHSRENKKKRSFWKKKRWILMTIMFAVTTIVVLSFAAYREIHKKQFHKNNILNRYGYMFREVNGMASTELLISDERIPAEEIELDTNETCTVTCHPKKKFLSILGLDENFKPNSEQDEPRTGKNLEKGRKYYKHGCCISFQKQIAPDRLPNQSNQMRRLVQFKEQKQLLLQDECRHIAGCNRGCKCMQQNIIVVALVVDDDVNASEPPSVEDSLTFANARLENVVYAGWCKCFNQ